MHHQPPAEAAQDEHDHRYCGCAELRIERPDGTAVRIPKPAGHDCKYVLARNKLVPKAEALANRDCGGYGAGWPTAFTCHMEALAKSLRRKKHEQHTAPKKTDDN